MRRCCCKYKRMNDMNQFEAVFPKDYMYGHAYVPKDLKADMYDPESGLEKGTMFSNLYSSYYPGKSIDIINYLEDDKEE